MHLVSTSSELARSHFSKRLLESLRRIGYTDSPTRFAKAFNSRSGADPVTVHGARKWITGGSIPTQARIVVLAKWLGVDAGWLRFGDSEGIPSELAVADRELKSLHSDLDLLSAPEVMVVRGLVDALFKARKLKA